MKKKLKDFFTDFLNKKFLISIIALMLVQALLYWGVKLLQIDYHYINATIDSKIPFVPHLVYVYNMFYPAVFISFYNVYNHDKETYFKGILAGILGFLVTDIIFLTYSVDIVLSNLKRDSYGLETDQKNKDGISGLVEEINNKENEINNNEQN